MAENEELSISEESEMKDSRTRVQKEHKHIGKHDHLKRHKKLLEKSESVNAATAEERESGYFGFNAEVRRNRSAKFEK